MNIKSSPEQSATAKREIEQIYYLSREIKMWEQEIEVLTARYLGASKIDF